MRTGGAGNIKVIEKAYLERDKSIAIIRVGQKDYLLGVSQNNVSLLQELEEGQIVFEEMERDISLPAAQFASVIKSKLGKDK